MLEPVKALDQTAPPSGLTATPWGRCRRGSGRSPYCRHGDHRHGASASVRDIDRAATRPSQFPAAHTRKEEAQALTPLGSVPFYSALIAILLILIVLVLFIAWRADEH
jgi:hypothetical protein